MLSLTSQQVKFNFTNIALFSIDINITINLFLNRKDQNILIIDKSTRNTKFHFIGKVLN
jgi:hypothetical protein